MSFESFLEKITTFHNIDNVLVCEASFSGLRATAVNKKGENLTTGQEVSSDQFELGDAVTELVDKARQKGWKGEHAILVTPAVSMAVLDLAIPPANKLPVQQLAETMQWEVEPAFNQHQRVMLIGQLLQFYGHLNTDELEEVLEQQATLANAKGSAAVYKVFGELAKEMFGLSQADLANCLSRQKWFVSENEGLKCGWHALNLQPMQKEAVYKWLVAGMNQGLLREWQAAFSKHAIKLEACYPLVAGGVTEKETADKRKEPKIVDEQRLLLELHQGVIAGVVLDNGEPLQIQTMSCHASTFLSHASELYHELGAELNQSITLIDSLSANEDSAKQNITDLSNIIGREIEADYKLSAKVSIAMRNAAFHFLNVSKLGHVESVSTDEPLAPVMQRIEVRAVLAAMALIAIILLSETSLFLRQFYIEAKSASIAEDVGSIRSTIQRIKDETKKVDVLKAEIKDTEAEKKQADTLVQLVSKELPARNERLSEVLNALEKTVTEDVVIEKISEDTILGFKISAWSLSEQAAQEFVKFFQIETHAMGYQVKDMTVTEETGRLGLIGYALNFSMTRLNDKDWLIRKQLGNRPLSSLPANVANTLR
ncbi:MAG: hypothetical protein ACSHWN_05775 [Methylophilaceae bacterium]